MRAVLSLTFMATVIFTETAFSYTPPSAKVAAVSTNQMPLRQKLKLLEKKQTHRSDHFIFDLPVTYNRKVAVWISFFQTRGKNFFRNLILVCDVISVLIIRAG